MPRIGYLKNSTLILWHKLIKNKELQKTIERIQKYVNSWVNDA